MEHEETVHNGSKRDIKLASIRLILLGSVFNEANYILLNC